MDPQHPQDGRRCGTRVEPSTSADARADCIARGDTVAGASANSGANGRADSGTDVGSSARTADPDTGPLATAAGHPWWTFA